MKNRFLIGILMVLLIVTMFPVTQSSAESKNTSGQEIDKKEYQVSFRKVDSWEGHINGEITIKNIGDFMIKDWQLEMDFDGKIENIWNASVVSYDDRIVLSNDGWNRDIAVGGEVNFGFVASIRENNTVPCNMHLQTDEINCLNSKEIFNKEELEELKEEIANLQIEDNPYEDSESFAIKNLCDVKKKLPGYNPRTKGTILITTDKYKGVLDSGHAAIVYDHNSVVEAMGDDGIISGKNNWVKSKKEFYSCVPRKLNVDQMGRTANYCHNQIGKKYNYNFFDIDTRKAFYCSHLVYASYIDLYKINLNTDKFKTPLGNPIHPYEILSNSKMMVVSHVKDGYRV